MVRDRLEIVEERIAKAVARAGRQRSEITLVAVTKAFPASAIREGYEAGLRDFGENYVQEFEAKSLEVQDLPNSRFHFIGHLQSNKAKRAAQLFDVIQTVDSAKLARRLSENFEGVTPLEVMLEVKLSPEEAKSGIEEAALMELMAAVKALPHLRLIGLMTMPPWSDDLEASRPYFRELRVLAESCGLACLSMGMSHDLEVAIEEGATHIRVGTALFGPRKHL